MEPGPNTDPISLFQEWYAVAQQTDLVNPDAMALATVSPEGRPSVRVVLLKHVDERGFVFYTNRNSRKGRDLDANPVAALSFYWDGLGRQVRVEGPVQLVDSAEADSYFAGRPRDSQLGAWASRQSEPLESREVFEAGLEEMRVRFDGGAIPRPSGWVGFRVIPERIEFWVERPHRMHDRYVYRYDREGWTFFRLYP